MIALLNKTVQRDPQHGRAHVRMAAICLRQFDLLQSDSESGMGLAEIRDAALQSEFESHQAMVDWVMRVAGENAVYLQRVLWHARRGIQLTPTEGRGYLYLSEVAFLDPQLHTKEADLMRQAYKVRPYDPSIQFVHGRYELLSGNQERTVALWKQAFRRGTRIRRRVIEAVASQGSVEEILTIFEPDRKGLRDLFEYYRLAEANAEMRFVGQRYVEALETEAIGQRGDAAGELWFAAQFVHATLGNVEKAVQAARNAVLAQPHEYRNHYACALRLRDAELWQDAVKEFRWCQQRKPQNTELPLVIAELQRAQQQAKADTAFHPYSIRSASSGPGTGAEIQ